MTDEYNNHKIRTAIALHYDGENTPTVSAKGVGEIADKILAIAKEHGIPIEQDPILTEMLSQLKLDEEIPEQLYITIAEVIAFAYLLAGKFPQDHQPPL